MAVVGQKISTLVPTSTIESTDRILIARQGANWGLLGSAIASSSNLNSLSAEVKSTYIPKPINPTAGQLLTWNGSTNTWVPSGAPVSVPKGTNTGDLLVYNKTTSSWTTQPSAVLIPPVLDPVPIGTIMAYVSSSPPAGWLVCDGRLLNKTGIYADLYKIIGDTFTSPALPTTFRIPDLRGEFVRGWDGTGSGARGVDPGRVFGSSQTESISAHSHSIVEITRTPTGFIDDVGDTPQYPIPDIVSPGTTGSLTTQTSSFGGTETRPRNVALLYCIKYTTNNALNTVGLSAQTIIDSLPLGYLGQSQTWQDVTQQRQVNVWHANTTNKPICVNVSHKKIFETGFAIAAIAPTNNTSLIVTLRGTYGDGINIAQYISFIVPPNYSYKIIIPTTSGYVDSWFELK